MPSTGESLQQSFFCVKGTTVSKIIAVHVLALCPALVLVGWLADLGHVTRGIGLVVEKV